MRRVQRAIRRPWYSRQSDSNPVPGTPAAIPVVFAPLFPKQSLAWGVGHPVNPLPDVRRADAVCAKYRRPAGVTFSFQVCEYSIEPPAANRRLNLFSKYRWRAALADEPIQLGPEVAGILVAEPFSRQRLRLAWA